MHKIEGRVYTMGTQSGQGRRAALNAFTAPARRAASPGVLAEILVVTERTANPGTKPKFPVVSLISS